MRRWFLSLPLLAACLILAACGPRETAVERGNREQILQRGLGYEIGTLDPHLAVNIGEMDVISSLFEGLVAEDPVDLHPVPGVAERWDISPDGLVYTFHLRADAKWSDGRPVTAQDFVASWHRMLTPSLAAENAGLLYVLQGAEAFHKGVTKDFASVGATALDARTLRVTLEHPTGYFLSLLTHTAWLPVPVETIARYGSTFDRSTPWARAGRLIGNGAFVLKAWDANGSVTVAKAATYWDSPSVHLLGIRFLPYESIDSAERAFRSGQLHVTYVLPYTKIETYRRDAPQFLRADPYLNTYFLRLNVRTPALSDVRVRRALALAIDRDAIVGKILRGGQQPADAFTPPGLGGYEPPPGLHLDLDAARQELADAGYPDGKGLPPLELLFNTSDNHRVLAEALQAMWHDALGLDVRLVNQEFKVVLAERRAGNYQILLSDWVGDYLDASTFLDVLRGDSGSNHTGWANADYDAALFAAARQTDPAARLAQLREAETRMLADAPIIPLYYNTHVFLLQPAVKGWHPTLLDHHPYKAVRLEP